MSAANFILVINLFVAATFAAGFAFVASQSRSAYGASWLALGYGTVVALYALEFSQPHLSRSEPIAFIIFLAFLGALAAMTAGVARHYMLPVPWRPLAAIALTALVIYAVLTSLPRGSVIRPFLYQTPYILTQILACTVILQSRRRGPIDIALLVVSSLAALQFAAKPFLAVSMGMGESTQSYLTSEYGAYSLTFQTIFLVSVGLLLLLGMVWDLVAEVTARSETDKLSGLLNRRGFEDHAERAIGIAAQSGQAATMIVADLDHFKHINDSFGHAIGDRVIAAFAKTLGAEADPRIIVGRLGGEEFAVFLPSGIGEGRAFAEQARKAFAAASIDGVSGHQPITASFGVTELQRGDSLSELLRRADVALYDAKKGGRNRVCIAHNLSVATGVETNDDENVRRRGSRRPRA